MPPEPLPWDRKDFYKERKLERTESPSPQPSTGRWRDSSSFPAAYQHGSFREFGRWGSADFRRPPGNGKQGSWHLFAEENGGHGYIPSRSGDKVLNDECLRQSFYCGEGKYIRNSSRGPYSHRDWRAHSWEMSNGFPYAPGRPHDVNEHRSVDDMLTYPSHTHSDFAHSCDQLQKDQHENKTTDVHGLGMGQRSERENSVGSIDWKPLKWSRSGSLSSRGSGFSHSSSSRSLGVDPVEGKPELQQETLTPLQSPSGDAAACVTSAAPSDEKMSRKKQRLGWGEGLAKYEKKKEVPDTCMNSGEATHSVGNAELNNSLSPYLADKSPTVLGFSDCTSPATPSSVACSSSPGVEEKSFGKAANIDNDTNNLCGSPSIGFQIQLEGPPFNLEKLDVNSIINMGSSLVDLLQSDDPSTVDSRFVRSTAVNKLLLCKGDILKALEVTESKLDSLENELKSLKADSRSRCPCPATSSSLHAGENKKVCEEQEAEFAVIPRPTPLKIDTCGDMLEGVGFSNGVSAEVNVDVKDGDIDSPGTATSKFVEPSSLEKAVPSSDVFKFPECSSGLGSVQLKNSEEVILATDSINEETSVSISVQGSVVEKNDAQIFESSNTDDSGQDMSCNVILSTNRELANKASEVFNKLLLNDQHRVDVFEVANAACSQIDSYSVREKLAMQKQHLRIKEKILTLKFKAHQYAWKEEMQSPLIRKYRARSQKKYELSLRSHGGSQKHRSSICSRLASPARILSLEPNAEIINYANKVLSDSHVRVYRDALKMPSLILDDREKKVSRFISSNGLVIDPCAVEKERSLVNPWTAEEKEIFMDKLATFGKDFRKIASFLDHKTTADCVEFYYTNHKNEFFEKTKKKLDLSKQARTSANSTYLLTSGKKWSRELNAASLDVLGAASVIAANAESGTRNRKTSCGGIFSGGRFGPKSSRFEDSIAERSRSFEIAVNDQETVAADVLAGICGSMSSEAMGSCITSSADLGESYHHEWKSYNSVVKRHSTSDVTQIVEDDTCSGESCGEMDTADWTDEEKSVFIHAISRYGKDFAMISRCVQTRSRDQCKVFFSKARKCLGLDTIHPTTQSNGTPMSDDANGGGSDMEDACVLNTVVCSDKFGSRVEDLPSNVVSMNMGESDFNGEESMQTDQISDKNMVKLLNCRVSEAMETTVYDVCQPEPISESCDDLYADRDKTKSVQIHESPVSANQNTGNVTSVSIEGLVDPCSPSLGSVVELNSVPGCTEGFRSEGQGTSLAKTELDEHDTKCSADSSCQSISRLDSSKISEESIEKISSSDFSFNTKNLNQVPSDLDSGQKPSALLLLEKKSSSTGSAALHDSDALQCDKVWNQDRLSSTLDYQDNEDKLPQKSVSGERSGSSSGNPVVNLAESHQILSGYPLQISTMKKMNGVVGHNQHPEGKSMATSEKDQHCYLQKCSSKSLSGIPLSVQNMDQANHRPKSHSRSLSDTDKPCRNGNVKLFGQILNTSSQDDNQEKGVHLQRHSMKPSNTRFTGHATNLKFNGHNNVDGSVPFSKYDRNSNHIASENVPRRSYGYWDGNRIQTGLTSLPDSLVAKYPAAFVNYQASSSSQLDQQKLQTAVRSNDRNGVTVLPTREISNSNGVVDYQLYRSRDHNKVAPFSVDMKPRQETFSEIQRQNGFDSIPDIQQQARGVVGMNVSGRGGGVLLGRSGPSLSDPVAVLKMQYGGGRNPSSISEESSWRGKGDNIGR